MALGFGATLVAADGRNGGGAGLRGQLKGAPGISACEPGRSHGGDRGAAVAALRGGGGDGADWWARLAATGRGQRAAESGRWLVGSGRQAVRGDLGAGRAGLRGMGRAERGQAGDEAGRAERNRPGWSGPGEPSAGPRAWAERTGPLGVGSG